MKKSITTALATLGVLASVSMPVLANAATVTPAHTLSTTSVTSSYTVNPFLMSGSATNSWGTDTLTCDDASQEFDWKVSPVSTAKSYTYNLYIDYYIPGAEPQYLGTVAVPTASGVGVLSGAVAYPTIYNGPGRYTAKLYGNWTASDGTSGTVGSPTCTFGYAL